MQFDLGKTHALLGSNGAGKQRSSGSSTKFSNPIAAVFTSKENTSTASFWTTLGICQKNAGCSPAYFHAEANEATKRKARLIENEIVSLFSIQNGYGYVEYYNYDLDKTTSGWINLRDLEPSEDNYYN